MSGPIDRAAWEKAHGTRGVSRRNDILSLSTTCAYLIRSHVTVAIIVTDDMHDDNTNHESCLVSHLVALRIHIPVVIIDAIIYTIKYQ